MPSTRIATGTWAVGREGELMDAIQSALAGALKLPEWDRDLVLDCYPDERRAIPAGRSKRFTLVEITLFAGRSLDAKRKLYRLIVENLGALGVPAEEVKTVLIEVPAENWGIRGGQPGSEVDLGFRIDV